jgi:cytochrome P450
MTALAGATVERWPDGETIDAAAEMTRLTLAIVVAALFGADLERGDATTVGGSLTEILAVFDRLVSHPLGPLLQRLPTPRTHRLAAARSRLDGVVERLVAARRDGAGERDDLLAALLAARHDGAPLDPALLRDEIMTIVLAGHETTTNWLAFTWLALAEHRDVEERLHAELGDALGGRPPTPDDLRDLPYLHAVLEEVLRLYPPVWGIGRRARSARALGPYVVPRGAVISICQFVLHRDPRVFTEPLRFAPDRWLAGERPPRGAYIPFADGPRTCIGEHFARTEAALVVATIAQRVRLVRDERAPVALDARITLRPRGGLPLRVVARR